MKTHVITGGAGFIAVNLAGRLLATGDRVMALDDLSRGKRSTLGALQSSDRFVFDQVECADATAISSALDKIDGQIDEVWHLAANSDIPAGVTDHKVDLHRTFLTTVGILDIMRARGIGTLHFASSSAIYGDHGDTVIHEDIGPLKPISNYGAMKLASEALIGAAVETWLERADIFRFPNVIGVPATHGVILDFVRKLKSDPNLLHVLGNGSQQKAYLHVDDLIDAVLHIRALEGRHHIFNIGPIDDGITVRAIAEAVRDRVAQAANIAFGEGDRGWVGDIPRFRYSVERLSRTGWRPRLGSKAAVLRAVDEIAAQEGF